MALSFCSWCLRLGFTVLLASLVACDGCDCSTVGTASQTGAHLQAPVDDRAEPDGWIALQPDVPGGYPDRVGAFRTPLLQDVRKIRFRRGANGKFQVDVGDSEHGIALTGVDLRPFVARLPAAGASDPVVRRVALTQAELNRNQTTYPTKDDDRTVWIANNCLKRGLWEVGINEQVGGKAVTVFHAWFEFPEELYSEVYQEVNQSDAAMEKNWLNHYPKLDGFEFPLGKLRTVAREPGGSSRAVLRADAPIRQFGEQRKKAPLLLNQGLEVYGDFSRAEHQPIRTAKFEEPGFYSTREPMEFDLRWLSGDTTSTVRMVQPLMESQRSPALQQEVEVRFSNGYRLILGSSRLEGLVARAEEPTLQKDTLALTFGIGTPSIYATASQREAEFAAHNIEYLMLLDGKGNHLDNHTIGLDRVYLWKEARKRSIVSGVVGVWEPERIHLLLVGYERTMLVADIVVALEQR